MTRNGKIARLPSVVREEVNKRLRKGEPGKYLVAWLNSIPKVQDILKKHFQGYAVTEQNLCKWRRGGFEDWLGPQEFIESALTVAENSDELQLLSNGGDLRPPRYRYNAEPEHEPANRTESKSIQVDPTGSNWKSCGNQRAGGGWAGWASGQAVSPSIAPNRTESKSIRVDPTKKSITEQTSAVYQGSAAEKTPPLPGYVSRWDRPSLRSYGAARRRKRRGIGLQTDSGTQS